MTRNFVLLTSFLTKVGVTVQQCQERKMRKLNVTCHQPFRVLKKFDQKFWVKICPGNIIDRPYWSRNFDGISNYSSITSEGLLITPAFLVIWLMFGQKITRLKVKLPVKKGGNLRSLTGTNEKYTQSENTMEWISRVPNDHTRIPILIQAERDRHQTYINKGLTSLGFLTQTAPYVGNCALLKQSKTRHL